MVDLSAEWLGLSLVSPVVVSASPLSANPDAIAVAVEAGAGAVIMYSLFEEQITSEQMAAHRFLDGRLDQDAEAAGILRPSDLFSMDAEPYLHALARLKKRVNVPVVASLNGTTKGGWTRYAQRLEEAGADALELNLYEVAPPPDEPGLAVEARQLAVAHAVVNAVKIPVNVKLTPFYASVTAFARALAGVGVRGVTVFNRFYQPDVDLETLDVDRQLVLSTSVELPLRLHALASLSAYTELGLTCTGGVHTGLDAAKAILSGAHVVALASALLTRGPEHVGAVRDDLATWLTEKGYRSVREARGILDLKSAPDPRAWERLNYMRMLEGWQPRLSRR